jgi:hypothetical protein
LDKEEQVRGKHINAHEGDSKTAFRAWRGVYASFYMK